MKLENQVAVLTGAASGIGRALATLLAERGCHLALVDRDEAGLRETLALLPHRGKTFSTHVVDLVDRQAIRDLPSEVLKTHKTVHLLINNAGVALGGTFEQVTEEDFDWVMNINFRAVVDSTRAFLPILRGNGAPGRIVNLSSLFGLVSPPGQAAYSASKFAVRGFSNSLRHELANTPIGVTVVHPGGIATSIANNAKAPQGIDAQEVERHKKEMNKVLKMPAQKAAQIIVRAIEGDKGRVIVGTDALVLSLIERVMPVGYWAVVERLMGKPKRP
jgi:short-subunit dehydrogenase